MGFQPHCFGSKDLRHLHPWQIKGCQYATHPRTSPRINVSQFRVKFQKCHPKPQTNEYAMPPPHRLKKQAMHLPRYSYHVISRMASQKYTIKLRCFRPNNNKIWYNKSHQDPVETFEMVHLPSKGFPSIQCSIPTLVDVAHQLYGAKVPKIKHACQVHEKTRRKKHRFFSFYLVISFHRFTVDEWYLSTIINSYCH